MVRMKTGIFICHCGHNIKHTVDVKGVSAFFKQFPSVVVSEDYPFVCYEPAQDMIQESIEKYFRDLAAKTPIDILLYNIPQFSNEISLPVVQRLALDCPRLALLANRHAVRRARIFRPSVSPSRRS